MQELWFLRSACRLILIDIYMKFCEDSLNGFQVIERTQFCAKVPKGKNSKSINARVMVLAHCHQSINQIFNATRHHRHIEAVPGNSGLVLP